MLSALITIKSNTRDVELVPRIISAESKKDTKKAKTKEPRKKVIKSKTSQKEDKTTRVIPYEEVETFNGAFYSVTDTKKLRKKVKEPAPWDDEEIEGGAIHFNKDEERENENDKYERQDKEWQCIMKEEENKYEDMNTDETNSVFSADDTLSGIGENEPSSSETGEPIGGDMEDENIYDDVSYIQYDSDSEKDIYEDVFYSGKQRRGTYKEKKVVVYTGIDIMLDDEFIP